MNLQSEEGEKRKSKSRPQKLSYSSVYDQYAPEIINRGSQLGFQSAVYKSITHDSEHAAQFANNKPEFTSIERNQGYNSETNEKEK